MSQEAEHRIIALDTTSLEEGDLLSKSVHLSDSGDRLSEAETQLCDGEGGAAPSKGTRYA